MPKNMPLPMAKTLGKFGDIFHFFPLNSDTIVKMTSTLTFDDTKAKNDLFWKPKPVLDNLFIA